MSLITFASIRSCGVTTLAAGLGMTWPDERRRLLFEADPAGGTLAAQVGLASEPGLVSLAAAARRAVDPSVAFDHAQLIPGDVPVLCAPPAAVRARSALSMLSGLLGRLDELDADVLFDCGRLDPATRGVEVSQRLDLLVLAARPRLADLNALATFLEHETERQDAVLVLVGDGPYPANEVSAVLDIEVAGQVPWDPEAAALLGTVPASSRQLSRTPLVRALRSLAMDLAQLGAKNPEDPSSDVSAAQPAAHNSALTEVPS